MVVRLLWLSGRALAVQARCPGFDSRRLPAFSLSWNIVQLTSKFSYSQCEARVVSSYATVKLGWGGGGGGRSLRMRPAGFS